MSFISDSPQKYCGEFPTDTYHKFCKNIYSQNGEDGIIEQLLKELEIETGYCCEFGATDGIKSSNTFNLVKNKHFKALYIESNKSFFDDLIRNVSNLPNVTPIYATVTPNNLTQFLKNSQFPYNFDILSIDIDSYDYDVWAGFTDFKPKIVIIEANSYRDPVFDEYHQKPCEYYSTVGDPLSNHRDRIGTGTSFMPLIKLGLAKGYIPLSFTGNVIFIDKDFIHKLKVFPYKISEIPYDYIDLYTNLVQWSSEWYTNTGLMFNTAVRNYYKLFNKMEIDYKWCVEQMSAKGHEIWKC